jgi:hypothetical protein
VHLWGGAIKGALGSVLVSFNLLSTVQVTNTKLCATVARGLESDSTLDDR